jgi:hypothetical protein
MAPMEQKTKLQFRVISGSFAICRLPAADPVPQWAMKGIFISVTRTADELSIVCPAENVPQQCKSEAPWICLKIEGPFAFSQVGILHAFIQPLVEDRISIFAIATFDTDYVLIQKPSAEQAVQVLQKAGHELLTF